MSGRSAYVRKKITQTEPNDNKAPPEDSSAVSELSSPPQGQGTVAPNAGLRFLRFAEQAKESGPLSRTFSHGSHGSQIRESIEGSRKDASRPLDDFAYARARKPQIKTEDMSGIAKSGMRSAYDKKTDEVRKGLVKAFSFGSKKPKRQEVDWTAEHKHRPGSAATVRPTDPQPRHQRPDNHGGNDTKLRNNPNQIYELPGDSNGPPSIPPPTANLPPLPPGPQIHRWIGTGRPVQRWNKLRKDPELWDPNGDVLVYLGPRGQEPRHPSLRLSSHIIEATESRYLITLLREGSIEDDDTIPPSPPGAPPMLTSRQNKGFGHQSSSSLSDETALAISDGQISYEIYFPPPQNASKLDQIRHQLTSRNVFAVLCHVSLVGMSLQQALSDLHLRFQQYMPQGHTDNLLTLMSYISARGIDDVRNDPETAVGLLAWAEDPRVRWEEAWREAFVHAAGMYGTSRSLIESCADYKLLSPVTKALLERASLETQLRVQSAEERLAAFSFGDMWPASVSMTSSLSGALVPSPAKLAADRTQQFFIEYYRSLHRGKWPPSPGANSQEDQSTSSDEPLWLTRTVTQALQKDFGALYDYIINRDIIWDVSETRPSRKWLMISESGNKAFDADTAELPIQDMLVEFDNRQRFPHIPHPYPLVPDSIPPMPPTSAAAGTVSTPVSASTSGSINFLKRNRGNATGASAEASLVPANTSRPAPALERRVQLAYTESTNIYILASDFIASDLIDAFVRFEKSDCVGEIDPSLARRARWVVIYGVLQTLASVSVDAPSVRYRDAVSYHLSPQLKSLRVPPWSKKARQAGAAGQFQEATHELSYCWTTLLSWTTNSTSASEDDELRNDEDDDDIPGSPSATSYGFSYPPPAALSTTSRSTASTSARRSSRGGASDVEAAGWGGSTVVGGSSVASIKAPRIDSSMKRAGFVSNRRRAPISPPASLSGEWEPVSRRDMSDWGFVSSAPARRRRKNVDEILGGMDEYVHRPLAPSKSPAPTSRGGGVSPGGDRVPKSHLNGRSGMATTLVGWEGLDKHDISEAKSRSRAMMSPSNKSGFGPVFRDFDELDVDDIMPY